MDELLSKMLLTSEKITNDDKKLSTFFGKCAMARLLEVFINNPDKKLNIGDVLVSSDLSLKVTVDQIPLLVDNNMVLEEKHGHYKFYSLNIDNPLVKQISDFRNIVIINNARKQQQIRKQHKKTRNRQIDSKSAKKGRTRK